jgi:hypothetical protein
MCTRYRHSAALPPKLFHRIMIMRMIMKNPLPGEQKPHVEVKKRRTRGNSGNVDSAAASAHAPRGQSGNCFLPMQIGPDC